MWRLLFASVLTLSYCADGFYLADRRESFKGDQVLRVIPASDEQVQFLSNLEAHSVEIDFWTQPYNVGHDVDFRVPKPFLQQTKSLLSHHNLKYEILIGDVQLLVDKELASMSDASREKRDTRSNAKYGNTEYHTDRFLNNYNSHDEINAWLSKMNDICGARCNIHDIGTTGEGRTLRVIKIGGSRKRNKPKSIIWIDGGIHGREWISPVTTINFVYKLIHDYSSDRCTRHIAEAFDWYILPVANPDGYEYSRTRNRMWRKNRRALVAPRKPWWAVYYYGPMERYCYGVDLNRNFGFSWGVIGTSTNPCSDIFGGASSFSEPETKAIRDFTTSIHNGTNIKIYVSLHSYGQYWLYSWGYTRQLPDDYVDLDTIASKGAEAIFVASNNRTQYIVGPASRTLYASSGASDDWAKGRLGVRYAYTVELPPSDANAQGNGFLLPVTDIPNVVRDTWPGMKAMAAATLQKDRANSHARHTFCNP